MAAGLGFKDFTTGEVLTAADVDGYLMQGIWVFASATARDAAVTSPQEGNFAYLKDTNVTTYYTGSAWANVDTTGMTNPMTTTGDTIYSSSGSTPARLGIGTTGQVLTVSGGLPSWQTPTGGGTVVKVQFASATAEVTSSSATYIDTGLTVSITPTSASSKVLILGMIYFGHNTDTDVGLRLLRGATDLNSKKIAGNASASGAFSYVYLDSPATTSALTYKFQFNRLAGAGTAYFNLNGDAYSSILAMEIGA